MSFETYNVFFSGQIINGQDPEQVRQKIGGLFKLDGEKLDRLFSGQPVAIKKNVDMDQAVKFRVAFREAGALVEIKPIDSPPAVQDVAPPPSVGPVESEPFTLSEPNHFDLSDCAPVVEVQPLPDIRSLTLDQPGVTLDESPAVEELSIDTDELTLDEIGSILDDSPPVETVEIDTQDLSLSPAKEGSLEEFQQPTPPTQIPNIDHLKLEEEQEPKGGKAKFVASEE